jgi:predicted helicase
VSENGIVAFVSNRSFIESRTFDGFRKAVAGEFNDIYVIDLGGDVRIDPRLSGTKHNVFGIQIGVALSFMVKRAKAKGCRIRYSRRPQLETAEEKRAYLGGATLEGIAFEEVRPNARQDWIKQTANDFDTLVPVASKETKFTKSVAQARAIFKMFSLGVATNRDDWVYSLDKDSVRKRIQGFIEVFELERERWNKSGRPATSDWVRRDIKWTSELEAHLRRGGKLPITKIA